MRRTAVFQEVLRQMSIHFTASDIVTCVFVWAAGYATYGFMLHHANGEYWYVTNFQNNTVFELFKFPPPIPAVTEIRPWPSERFQIEWSPRDINDYIKEMGGTDTLFLQEKT